MAPAIVDTYLPERGLATDFTAVNTAGGTIAEVTPPAPVHGGAASLRIVRTGDARLDATRTGKWGSSRRNSGYFWLNATVLPTGSSCIFTTLVAIGSNPEVWLDSAGRVTIRKQNNPDTISSPASATRIVPGQWFRIAFWLDTTTGSWFHQVAVNDDPPQPVTWTEGGGGEPPLEWAWGDRNSGIVVPSPGTTFDLFYADGAAYTDWFTPTSLTSPASTAPTPGSGGPRNTLGCGRYTAQIWTRGGDELVFDRLPVSNCTWSRVLDDTSDGTADLAGLGRIAKCFAAIRDGEPFEHELAICRDGEPIWQGPMTQSDSEATNGQYTARDLSTWWDRRKEETDRIYTATDLAMIFEQLANDAMASDSSPNITVSTSACGVTGDRKYLAGQHLLLGPLLRELSSSGVDWTVVQRTVLAGGLVVPTEPIVLLQDKHLVRPPKVSRNGQQMATRVTVIGAGGGEGAAPVVGVAQDDAAIAKYGLIDKVISNDSIRDSDSAAALAQTTLEISAVPIIVASEVTLDSDAPVLLEQLVPGALVGCAFRTSGIPMSGTFRIQKVAGAGGGSETITVTLQPVGTTGGSEDV